MNQTKIESMLESIANVLIGYFVALVSQLFIFHLVGINVSMTTNLVIGFWFTMISLARSYIIRRWFNARLHRAITMAATRLSKGN